MRNNIKQPPKIGDFVRSTYQAHWVGVIVDFRIHERTKEELYVGVDVVVVQDQHGKVPHKRIIRYNWGYGWFVPTDPVDLSGINPDWLKPPKGKTWNPWTWPERSEK